MYVGAGYGIAAEAAPTVFGEIAPVGAASAATSPIDEITVTATLRGDTTLRHLPASVALLDRATIGTAAVQHFEELAALVPNLNGSGEGNRARYFQVRGIGELEQYEGAPNAAVGFIIDDIDFSALGGIATIFDTERVEVLRGPQGTRYGANALAGLIYVQSVAPPPQAEAYAEALAGSDGARGFGAAAGGPVPGLEQELGWRVAVQQFRSDGFRDNAYLRRDDTYDRDELTARARLRWRPAPGWQADLTGMVVDLDNGYDAWALDNSLTTQSDAPGRDAQRTAAGSLRVSGPLSDAVTLVSITGLADSDIRFSFDADWGNPPGWAPDLYAFTQRTDRDRRTLNQELRLVSAPAGRLFGRGDWVLGGYALDLDEDNHVTDLGLVDLDDSYCANPDVLPGSCDPFASDRTVASAYEATSVALFGELQWPLGERTRLALGLRGERREGRYNDALDDRASGFDAANDFSPTDRLWGGEISLGHDLDAQTTAYARVARGYRAGGFNPSLARVEPGDDQVQFGPEALWSYEAGLKLGGGPTPWSGAVNVFWQEREDMQVKVPLQYRPGDPSTFVFTTDNAESGHAVGAEGELAWALNEAFSVEAHVAWLRTEIDRFNAGTCLDGQALPDGPPCFEGHPFPHAPPVSFALSGLYQRPDGGFARVDFTGRAPFYFDYDDSTGADRKAAASQVVNLRAGRQWARWRAEAWVRNLFDEEYGERGFYFGNEPPAFAPTRYIRLGDPRQAGVTLTWRL
jgi:outer membrane receptor protein involved in Fe transport